MKKKSKAREWWVSVDKDGVLWGEALGSRRDKREELEFMKYTSPCPPISKLKIIKVREVKK